MNRTISAIAGLGHRGASARWADQGWQAKSVAYLEDVGSGIHVARLLERLGIAEAVKPKTTRPESDIVSELVAKGEITGPIATPVIKAQGMEPGGSISTTAPR